MKHKTTPSFILELGLEVNMHEEAELNKRLDAGRQLYNACLGEAKKRLSLLRDSKEFRAIKNIPKTVKGKPNPERTNAFRELNTKFGFREYDLHKYATTIRHSWIEYHIDASTAQKLATKAFKAVQRMAFGLAKKVRFKGKNRLKSLEGKSNKTGIRYKDGVVYWSGLELPCIIDIKDVVVAHGLSHRVKYCRIVKRIFDGKTRFFVQLILEGIPYQKHDFPDKIVGLDIGPSTIAHVSDDHAKLEKFCNELKDMQAEIRRLQRKLNRQRRANNPQNYNGNGTIKKGKKHWNNSKRYLETRRNLADLQRRLAAHRKSLHGNLANRILKHGKFVKTEKLSYKAFQKRYGKSVSNRAPGMFVAMLRRKAENANGSVDEFSTYTTKLSQYCHKCGEYTKKPLSQRWHQCCDLNIQRDLYSAFLAGSVVKTQIEKKGKMETVDVVDTADVNKRWRSAEAMLQQAVSELTETANERHTPRSFGISQRKSGSPVKSIVNKSEAGDVVPRQLLLF